MAPATYLAEVWKGIMGAESRELDAWKEILGDTPSRLEVDFASHPLGQGPVDVSSIMIHGTTLSHLQEFCDKSNISKDAFVLGVLHHTLRAYSHQAFAIGVYQDSKNIFLVPFEGNASGGVESLQSLNDRWMKSILPLSKTSYSEVKKLGYGCNVTLSLNREQSSINHHKMNTNDIDLHVEWKDGDIGDGSIKISFESGIGRWPNIGERFLHIIHQMLAMSEKRSSLSTSSLSPLAIDNLLPQEKEQALMLATGPKDPIIDCCLHELVEKQARLRPNATALMNKCGTETMTYAELDAKAHRLAVELQQRGAKPNTYVGILMGEKTFEMYVAVLGVLKAGAAYVPMDAVLFPPERIKFIAKDTDMKLLVTVGEHAGLVQGGFDEVLVEEAVMNVSYDEVCLERIVKSTDCAYMIYTSGTTGVPKGVACHHIGPVNMTFYESGIEVVSRGIPGEDVIGCSCPLVFDFFILGYIGALGSGLALSLDMKCCTMLMCTPSVADIYLQDEKNNIGVMLVGADVCIQGLESKVQHFINGYGPTEASIWCTAGKRSDTIGRPLPNTLCYVVHPDDGTLCPPGVSGELWVGGIGPSIGYHNRPELTAEKFISNPFGSGKIYRTGDRVKWNNDGELVFLGRFDHQVKVRGYRIELGEIQAELEKQEGVNGALVVVHDEKLVAFVASGDNNSSSNEVFGEQLTIALKSEDCSLTSYMIPSHILVMDEFPLTLNGKIDRKRLIAGLADLDEVGIVTEYVPPMNDEEEAMVAQWQAVLKIDRDIGMNDNFYDLGGHSILAMALAADLGCDVRVVAAHPTPASLLAHLQSSMDSSSGSTIFASLEEVPDLTRTEQRMVFMQLQNPGHTTYNMPFCVKFNGDIDLLKNVQAVVDMLPILRTRFVNGRAVEGVKVRVEVLSITRPDDTHHMMYSPFDMAAGPLCWFGVDRKTNTLYGNIHHSIADGRSFQILFDAISTGVVKSSTREWSIRKYASFEALPEVVEDQRASVQKYVELLGETPPRLELDFASPGSYHNSSITLDSTTRTALEEYCRSEKVSLFSLALGVMHKALRAYSHEAFAIGTAYDARPSSFRDTVGMFVNTVLVPFGRGKEGGEETLKELHERWTNNILPLATTPYDMVSAKGYGCNVCLAFNVGIGTSRENHKHIMLPVPYVKNIDGVKKSTAKFDLSVDWMESNTGDRSIKISFESGIGRWPNIGERFLHIIHQMLTMSEKRSSLSTSSLSPLAIDNLLPQEKEQALMLATGPKDPIIDCCLHELVEKQARLRPNATALMNKCGTEAMTYAELDAKAHRLAVELQQRGAKPNTYVGILMGEKTFEMYVAVLGVLKAGAAYVPMDAVLFPPERIKFIAEDTDMKLLVTVGEHAGLVQGGFDEVLVEEAVMNVSYDEVCLERIVKSADCAYMIYTSGTTGVPKGVACHHIGPVNMIFYNSSLDPFSGGVPGEDVVGCAAPLIFDMFVHGYFGALGSGLALSLDMKCCTILMCTPSVADIFLQDKSNNIKVMSVGGEACLQGLESRVNSFFNGYGPTEASMLCTLGNKPDTIGRPLPNTLCYVVHPDDGTLCPPGVSGELWVGGIGPSIGYHNRPELTAEKFISNPFGSGKIYRTGDRVKWNNDGELVFLGRFDHQVKVRGYRIELGEIQAELEKQEGVNGALVVVHDEKLVAFVASGDNNSSSNEVFGEQLMIALKSEDCSLTSYMIPWKIHVMDEFPLTLNGKIDRKHLISLLKNSLSQAGASSIIPPFTSIQEKVCKIFKEVLEIDIIGIDCDFVERGGHSLLVMQAVKKIREEFNIDSFSVRDLFNLKTPRNIAVKIDAKTNSARPSLLRRRSSMMFAGASRRRLSFLFTSSNMNVSNSQGGENPYMKIMIKAITLLVLFASVGAAILPANIILGFRLRNMGGRDDLSGNFSSLLVSICFSIAALSVFFVCLTILARMYGYLLFRVIGKGPATIKRNSATFGLWYVFDKLWLVSRVGAALLLGGTKFHTMFYEAYGCNLGQNTFLEETDVRLPFMLTTGNNVVVEVGAKLETVVITKKGDVIVDELVVGEDTVVGPNAHIGLGARIGTSCLIGSLSLVKRGRRIEDFSIVNGHNVSKQEIGETVEGPVGINVEDQAVASLGWHFIFLLISFVPSAMSLLLYITILFFASSNVQSLIAVAVMYPVLSSIGQVIVAICMRLFRYCLVGKRASPGSERVYSKSFLRRNAATSLYHSSTKLVDGTVLYYFIARFIFGATIDVKSSFAPHPEEPDLTKMGHCVFGANGVLVRNKSFRNGGFVRYGQVKVGEKSMILDRAVISPDTTIDDNVMIGPITSVNKDTAQEKDSLLLGTPALCLNRNMTDEGMEIISEPLLYLILQYICIIYSRFIVGLLVISAFYMNGVIFYINNGNFSFSTALAYSFVVFPLSTFALVLVLLSVPLLFKWIVIGNFNKLQSKGLMSVGTWHSFKWIVCNFIIHEACAIPLQLVDEFWLTAMFWRLMGARIGKNTLIDSNVLLYEADLLDIGDDCRIEEETTLLCHKFNDGGLKLDRVKVPSSCSLEARSVVFPGSEIDENVTMLPLTCLNPGEKLTKGHWQGCPAEKVNAKTGKLAQGVSRRSIMSSTRRTSMSTFDLV